MAIEVTPKIVSEQLMVMPLPLSENKQEQFLVLSTFLNLIQDKLENASFFELILLCDANYEEDSPIQIDVLRKAKNTINFSGSANSVAFVLKGETVFSESTDSKKPLVKTEVVSESDEEEMLIMSNAILHVIVLTIFSLSLLPHLVLTGKKVNRDFLMNYFEQRLETAKKQEKERLSKKNKK